jgi:hypothetical protein
MASNCLGWNWPEKYPQQLFFSDYARQFMHRAVHENQREQNDLNRPEVRPHNFGE